MQDRRYYEDQLSNYPDVVTKNQLMAMLGGICEKTAQSLLQSDKIKHFRSWSFSIVRKFNCSISRNQTE